MTFRIALSGLNAASAELSVTATRQFAKRQRTWFRNRMAGWPEVDPANVRIDEI